MSTRVLVNDRCLGGGGGVAVYLRNVLDHWPARCEVRLEGFCAASALLRRLTAARAGGSAELLALCPLKELPARERRRYRLPRRAARAVQRAYALAFAARLRNGHFAGCFQPDHLAPVGGKPVFTTMHDLSVIEHPQWHPANRVAQWESDLPATLANTTRWIAVSQFTAGRMAAILGVPPERVAVIPLAGRPLAYPDRAGIESLKTAGVLPERFVLCLGTLEPRKNLLTLLDAWASIQRRGEAKLVLAGGRGWGGPEFWKALMGHPMAGEVLASPYVSDPAAAALLAGADAVLVPSHYEGFGLPVLEAFACGSPVICSRALALVELAGGAAETLDAGDVESWGKAMTRALSDASWRRQFALAGRRRAAQYSWARTAASLEGLMAEQLCR
jgi:alpha-1,3-rhamnosyl/mannosyltransferase